MLSSIFVSLSAVSVPFNVRILCAITAPDTSKLASVSTVVLPFAPVNPPDKTFSPVKVNVPML